MSLMNGLSSLGAGVAQFAGAAGLQQQKSDLESQQAVLADQLATTRESTLQQSAGQIAAAAQSTQNTFTAGQQANLIGANKEAAAALAGVETARATALASTQATAAQKSQDFEMAKAKLAATLPTPNARDIIDYSGAQPGTPEFRQGAVDLAMVKAGIPPSLFGGGASPASGTAPTPTGAATAPAAPASAASPSAAPLAGPRASAASGASPSATTPPAPVSGVPAVPATEPALDAAKAAPGTGAALPGGASGALKSGDPVNGQSEASARLALLDSGQQAGLHPEVLTGQPQGMQNLLKNIAAGKIAIPQGNAIRTGYWPAVLNMELLYNPGFSEATWAAALDTRKSVAAGPLGAGITAANTVLQHANEYIDRAADLNNGQIPALNSIENSALAATGSSRPLALQATVDALAAETRKVYAGQSGGTQADLDAWQKNFPINGSPAQQSASMRELVTLLHGRLTAVADQINGGMQTNLTGTSLLNPEARAAFDRLSAPAAPEVPASAAGRTLVGGAVGALAGPIGSLVGAGIGAAPGLSQGMQDAMAKYRARQTAPVVPPWVKPGDQYSASRGQARAADGTVYGAPQ